MLLHKRGVSLVRSGKTLPGTWPGTIHAQRLYHQSTAFTLAEREALLPAPWTVELDISAVKDQKEAAFHAHTSQLPVLDKVKPYWDKYGSKEHYTLAAASMPQPAAVTNNIFEDDFE